MYTRRLTITIDFDPDDLVVESYVNALWDKIKADSNILDYWYFVQERNLIDKEDVQHVQVG